MTRSILLFAYEINALTAKNLMQKRAGFGAKFKKFKALEIVDHVSACWNELESLFVSHDIKIADKILYTISLLDPLHIGKHRNDIVNNSFLMAVISDDSRFGRDAIEGARFYQYFDSSDFEKKQFSIFLDELKWQYASQEVGIFGWVEVPTGSIDKILKQIAVKFPKENDGELHFIEITSDGEIYPNFSSVKTQKFEGKLAGNYSITLSQSDYEKGLARLNAITNTVVSKSVVTSISDKSLNQEKIIGLSEKGDETENSTEESGRKTYTDDFKRQVANAASQDGATLASVGEQYEVSPTLVRNWKNKFSEENIDTSTLATSEKIEDSFSVKDIQKWLQSSETEGIIDTEGDLCVSLESSEETITDNPINLYLSGSHTLVCGAKSEKFEFETEIRTNEASYLKSDYLNAVDMSETFFTLNFQLKCHVSSNPTALPIKVKEGSIDTSKIKFDRIELAELSFVLEDDAYRIEGRIDGENGFVYGFQALTEEPEPGDSPTATKVIDDENSAEIYEYLWDVKEGDTVYLHIASYSQLDGNIELGFDGKVIAEDPVPDVDEHEGSALQVDEIDAKDLFPFEDYKTATAQKFIKFVHKLPKSTFEAVSKYITDGYDLIENNGVLEEAKDEAQLIKIGTAEGEPFESPDDYLDCLLQNINDEIEMYGLDGPISDDQNDTPETETESVSVLDISKQPIGSAEFKIEVASACAESGINYIEFAKIYNLNADELNAWAIDYLGEGLDDASKNDKVNPLTAGGAKDEILFDTVQHIALIKVSDDLGWATADGIAKKNLTILSNSSTFKEYYFIGSDITKRSGNPSDEALGDAEQLFINELISGNTHPLPSWLSEDSNWREFLVGTIHQDFDDFEYETGLSVDFGSEGEINFDDNIGKIGLRVSSISETSIKLSEDGLTILGETYSSDDGLYQVLEQGEVRYGLFP